MNKILVYIYIPIIEQKYDLFIPINRKIGFIKRMIAKSVIELSKGDYCVNNELKLINKKTNHVYDDNLFVIDTDIRNGCRLVLL